VLAILDEEMRRTTQLLGVASPAELDRSYVSLRPG
jgi:hypothetical protein